MSILDGEKDSKAEEMASELANLIAENAALKAKLDRKVGEGHAVTVEYVLDGKTYTKEFSLSFKAGDKGTVCVYGMGKFPHSFYPLHLMAILASEEALMTFVKANEAKLSWGKTA